MMGTQCSNNSCNRIPFFSANNYVFGGTAIGDPQNDNARLINENAPSVATWRSLNFDNDEEKAPPNSDKETTSAAAGQVVFSAGIAAAAVIAAAAGVI
jgi:hypothetical protein